MMDHDELVRAALRIRIETNGQCATGREVGVPARSLVNWLEKTRPAKRAEEAARAWFSKLSQEHPAPETKVPPGVETTGRLVTPERGTLNA